MEVGILLNSRDRNGSFVHHDSTLLLIKCGRLEKAYLPVHSYFIAVAPVLPHHRLVLKMAPTNRPELESGVLFLQDSNYVARSFDRTHRDRSGVYQLEPGIIRTF